LRTRISRHKAEDNVRFPAAVKADNRHSEVEDLRDIDGHGAPHENAKRIHELLYRSTSHCAAGIFCVHQPQSLASADAILSAGLAGRGEVGKLRRLVSLPFELGIWHRFESGIGLNRARRPARIGSVPRRTQPSALTAPDRS
jgi:hypothetical protein